MCRLSLITATLPLPTKISLMEILTLQGNVDRQDDGWGVWTQDGLLAKGADSYWKSKRTWISQIEPYDEFSHWASHVRSASAGTERTTHAAHPYSFDIGGDELLVAHNGLITGYESIYRPAGKLGDAWVNTDTWKAIQDLLPLMENQVSVTPSIFEEWTTHFRDTCSYVFILMFRNQTYVVRGNNQKTFFRMTVGDGYIGNTSSAALEAIKPYLDFNAIEYGEIEALSENSFWTVGGDIVSIDPQYKKYTYNPPSYNNYVPAPAKGKGNESDANSAERGFHPNNNRVNVPGTQLALPSSRLEEGEVRDDSGNVLLYTFPDVITPASSQDRLKLCAEITALVNPLRAFAWRTWLAEHVGAHMIRAEDGRTVGDPKCPVYVDYGEMLSFYEFIKNLINDAQAGTSAHKRIINIWNATVRPVDDPVYLPLFINMYGSFWYGRERDDYTFRQYVEAFTHKHEK